MALVHSWKNQGKILFKYRGQFPILLFVLVIPFLYCTDDIAEKSKIIWNSIAICCTIFGYIVRCYTIATTPKGTSGRNRDKQIADFLNSTGIYSLVRHPLYLGNYLIWIGIVIFSYNLYFIFIVSLLFWLYYERIMLVEEFFLQHKYGKRFLEWSELTPAFFPNFRHYIKSNIAFSFKTILRREYSGLLATVIGFVFIDLTRNYLLNGVFIIKDSFLVLLIIVCVLALILRSLKHYTNILTEKDRS